MRAGLTLAFSTRQTGPQIGRYIRHLKQTCGLQRIQILYAVNPGHQSLAELYNTFLQQARFDIVCLLHDDLKFQRNSYWGVQILRAFAAYPEYAAFSAAGGLSLSEQAVYWENPAEMVGQVTHLQGKNTRLSRYSERFKYPLEVLVLDGLLLALHRQRLWARPQNPILPGPMVFDEVLGGFHFYDIAFSLRQSFAAQAQQAGKCGVLTTLKLTHLSTGKVSVDYERIRQKFQQRYQQLVPQALKSDLCLQPLPPCSLVPAKVCIFIWHPDPGLPLGALRGSLETDVLQELDWKIYSPYRGQQTIAGIEVKYAANWSQALKQLQVELSTQQSDYLLLLDSRVVPLQNWLPVMLRHFEDYPQLGTLGVRLHYPDSHRIYSNGLELIVADAGALQDYDLIHRGIHKAYAFRNRLEWDTLGSPGSALMLPKTLFQTITFSEAEWIPGWEINLQALSQGYNNAVDSRLVGYWLEAEETPEPVLLKAYQHFLSELQEWFRQTPSEAIWRHIKRVGFKSPDH